MAKNIKSIAGSLGAKSSGRCPIPVAARSVLPGWPRCVENLQGRLVPGQGKHAGGPSDASWVRHPKIPMSERTQRRLLRWPRCQCRRPQGQPHADRRPKSSEALSGVPDQ